MTENSYDADEFYGRCHATLSGSPRSAAQSDSALRGGHHRVPRIGSGRNSGHPLQSRQGEVGHHDLLVSRLATLPADAANSLKNYSKMKRPPNQPASPLSSCYHCLYRRTTRRQSTSALQLTWLLQQPASRSPIHPHTPPSRPQTRPSTSPPSTAPSVAALRSTQTRASSATTTTTPSTRCSRSSQRLQLIFDLHTARRMKPQSTKHASRADPRLVWRHGALHTCLSVVHLAACAGVRVLRDAAATLFLRRI